MHVSITSANSLQYLLKTETLKNIRISFVFKVSFASVSLAYVWTWRKYLMIARLLQRKWLLCCNSSVNCRASYERDVQCTPLLFTCCFLTQRITIFTFSCRRQHTRVEDHHRRCRERHQRRLQREYLRETHTNISILCHYYITNILCTTNNKLS